MDANWAHLLREFREAERAVEAAAFDADAAAWDPGAWMINWIAAEDAADAAAVRLAAAFRERGLDGSTSFRALSGVGVAAGVVMDSTLPKQGSG